MTTTHVLPNIQDVQQISKLLINIRHDSNMTCTEMKQALNVSSNTLNRYFKAAVAIRPSNYLKIVELYKRVYNVEVEVLQSNVLQQDEEQNRAYRVTQLVNQLKQLTGCTEVLLKY